MNEKRSFIKKVWPKIESFLDRYGSANYDGYLGGKGWLGPYVWGENGDIVRIITKFCEDEFGFLNVHNESKIDNFRYANFNPKKEKKKRRYIIDIDVTDASNYKNAEEFRTKEHTLFIEVKHISKGCGFNDHEKKIRGFEDDCKKLQEQVEEGRCKDAIAILIDDGDRDGNPYVKNKGELIKKIKKEYPKVEPLIWQKTSK